MRKLLVTLTTGALVITMGSAAQGASTTVAGTGSYEKLVVNNGNNSLSFKIHAPGGECAIKYAKVAFRDRDGTRYAMEAGCYPGATWAANIVRGDTLIDCGSFTLTFNADNEVWTAKLPRSCLARLGAAIKVTQSYVDDYTPNTNEVPATPYVAQG